MKQLLKIDVTINEDYSVKGTVGQVNMLLFSGHAEGALFNGTILGVGTDTQRTSPAGDFLLSARYMLEGVDYTGAACRIFIENNGSFEKGFRPTLITDSAALRAWEEAALQAEVTASENGVIVTIWMEDDQ